MAHGHQIHLIRHGIAEEAGQAWPDDTKRPLTEAGARRLRRGLRGLAGAGVRFDLVLTSPLVRARQSADIVAAVTDPRPPVVVIDSLAPGASHQTLLADLAKHGKRPRLALVGHEPGLGELAARLMGLRQPLPFKKGGICRIDVDDLPPTGVGVLRWFMTPKLLRQLKKARR